MAILDKIRLSGTTYDIVDSTAIHSLDGYYTASETNAAITAATNALAESIAEQGYQTSGDVQNAISGKAEASDVQSLSGTVTAHTANTDIHVTTEDKTAWNAKADISDIPSVSGYADSVKYNSTSHHVEFYHGTTAGTKVFEYDASPFLIDGMVQNVEIKNVTSGSSQVTCLVVSFNTDAGKQDINIPISEIFDASNYYTKTEVDAELSGKTDNSTFTAYTSATDTAISGKASQSDLDTLSRTVTAHTANTDIHVTTSDKTTWNEKQDALVNQVNIKSINGSSILGSGDLTVDTGNKVEVSGTTLVFL